MLKIYAAAGKTKPLDIKNNLANAQAEIDKARESGAQLVVCSHRASLQVCSWASCPMRDMWQNFMGKVWTDLHRPIQICISLQTCTVTGSL